MEKLIEKINKYGSLHSEILKAFGTSGWESIEDHVTKRWLKNKGGDLKWLDESGTEYSYDNADIVGEEVEGYVMFYVRDNGDSFHAIFSKSLESENYEDYENEIGVEI